VVAAVAAAGVSKSLGKRAPDLELAPGFTPKKGAPQTARPFFMP
jgi:hypothetical protein